MPRETSADRASHERLEDVNSTRSSGQTGRSLDHLTVITVDVCDSAGTMTRQALRRFTGLVCGVLARYEAQAVSPDGSTIRAAFREEAEAVSSAAAILRTLAVSNRDRPDQDRIDARIRLHSEPGRALASLNTADSSNRQEDANRVLLTNEVRERLPEDMRRLCRPLAPAAQQGEPPRLRRSQRSGGEETWQLEWADDAFSISREEARCYCLEVTATGSKFRYDMRGIESGGSTVSRYDVRDVDMAEVQKVCREILDVVNDANRRTISSEAHHRALIGCGQRLYDLLLTRETKQALREIEGLCLLLRLDDNSVGLPWELLHDGESFLGRRFAVGRAVTTRGTPVPAQEYRPDVVTALVIADPQGDLPSAAQEGEMVKRVLSATNIIRPTIISGAVTEREVVDQLRDHRILHFCGHAEYNSAESGVAGWQLADGILSTTDIVDLAGGGKPMPSLVFCNACESAQTDGDAGERERRVHGIADAFLLAGTRHYIGTLWEVPDEASAELARSFYVALAQGKAVGVALLEARESAIRQFGESALIWAAYVLYGDPTRTFLPSLDEEFARLPREEAASLDAPSPRMRRSSPLSEKKAPVPMATYISIAAFFLMIALLYAWNTVRQNPGLLPAASSSVTAPNNPPPVQDQIAFIAERIKQGNAALPADRVSPDGWTSPALGFAVVNANLDGLNARDARRFLSELDRALGESRRLLLVDRAGIDYVLRELSLAAGQLSDPARSAEVGRIVGARLIVSLDNVPETSGGTLYAKLVDAQTTAVLPVAPIEYTDSAKAADALAGALVEAVEKEFALRGVASMVGGNEFKLNLGRDHGLRAESRIELDSGTGDPVKAVVSDVEPLNCTITTDGAITLREDGRVKITLLP